MGVTEIIACGPSDEDFFPAMSSNFQIEKKCLDFRGSLYVFESTPSATLLGSLTDLLCFLFKYKVRYLVVGEDGCSQTFLIREQGVVVHYIDLIALIKNKEACGRPKDLEDLKYLKEAAKKAGRCLFRRPVSGAF